MKHKEFMQEIDRSQKDPLYIPLQQPLLGSKISITKSMYILLGGMPGSGKTAIVDSVFLLDLYDWWTKNKDTTKVRPYWIYRSMERNQVYKRAKWLAYKMFKDHKILIDVPTIFNWPNKMYDLTPGLIKLMDSYDEYFDQLFEEFVQIISGPENPTGIYKHVWAYFTKPENGELLYKEVDSLDDNGNKIKKKIIAGYNSKKPNVITFHITDHIGKISGERGFNDKQILDKHSEYMGHCRDLFGLVPIDISQLNRNVEDTYRNVKTEIDVMPQDFKGSADIYENADIAIGMLNPYKLSAMNFAGYDIPKFVSEAGHNRYRSMKLLKNSYGVDDVRISYLFLGENGIMKELPSAKDFQTTPELYQHFSNPPNEYLKFK